MISAKRFHRIRHVLARRQPDLTVALERVNKEHNLSAILRNCDAVGVLDVHAVPPRHGLKVSGVTSAGAARWVRVHRHPDGASIVARLKERGMRIVAAHPDARAVDFRDIDFTGPTAILLGAELYGVSDDILAMADRTTTIPMLGMARSLNVSVASSLLLYEAYRQREALGMYSGDPPRIPEPDFSRLLFEWAYPELAGSLRDAGAPYPELGPDGEIIGNLDVIRTVQG